MQQRLRAPALQISETRGYSVTAFDRQTTPIGRIAEVRLPGIRLTWHRPMAVEVRQADATHRLPIHDATLRAISVIVLTGLAVVVLISLSTRRVRSKEGAEHHDHRGKSESAHSYS